MKASSIVGFTRARAAAHFRRRPFGQHAAGIEDGDGVAIFGLCHEMRGDDDRDAGLGERRDALPELAPRQGIGAAGRLVEEQDLRLVQQRRRHGQALLVAARQLPAREVNERLQLELGQRPFDAFVPLRPAQAIGAREKIQVLADRELRVEREFLRHVADVLARRCACGAQVEPGDAQGARRGRKQPAQHAEGRGLAGAVRAEKTEDLAAPDPETDVVDGGEGAEPAHEVAHLDFDLGACFMGNIACAAGRQDLAGPLAARCAAQEHHEPVLEMRRRRGEAVRVPARRRSRRARDARGPPAARRRRSRAR